MTFKNLAFCLALALGAGSIPGCDSSDDPAAPDAGVDGAVADSRAPDKGTTKPDLDVPDAAAPDKGCIKPDAAVPGACAKNKLTVFKGTHQVVIDSIKVGNYTEGFDLNNADCDNSHATGIDNILWVIGALANTSFGESMQKGEISIPFEFFDLDDVQNDTCMNFALYVGRFPVDADDDGEKAGGPLNKPGKDCNDNDKTIKYGAKEIAGNGVDDDCDGLADEGSGNTPGTDTSDADKDGQSIAAGDCDDRAGKGTTIKKGAKEICGDGLDNDCNGKADDGCMQWTSGQTFPLESLSLNTAGDEGLVTFRGATVTAGKLQAGPSVFGLKMAIQKNMYLDLQLTHVFIEAMLKQGTAGLEMDKGKLGGVLSARAMDQAPNFASDYYGSKDDSLLDVLVGPIGQAFGFPKDKDGNVIPDVDVDGDGIEAFYNSSGGTGATTVDTCVDGDGTVVKDKVDSAGKVTERCTEAKDSKGNYRFQDGWSISLLFTAKPTKLDKVVTSKGL